MNRILLNIAIALATVGVGSSLGYFDCTAYALDPSEEKAKEDVRRALNRGKQTESPARKGSPPPMKQISVKPGTTLCQVKQNPLLQKGIIYYVVENMKDNSRFKVGYHMLIDKEDMKVFTVIATITRSEIEDEILEMMIERAYSTEGEQVKELPLIPLVQSGALFPGVFQAVKQCPDLNKLLIEVEAGRKASKEAEQEHEAIQRARDKQYWAARDEHEIRDDFRKKSEMFCERELRYENPTKPVLIPKNEEECETLRKQAQEVAKDLRSKYPFVDFEVRNNGDGVWIEVLNQNP